MKKHILILCAALCLTFCGCSSSGEGAGNTGETNGSASAGTTENTETADTGTARSSEDLGQADEGTDTPAENAGSIVLNGDSVEVSGEGLSAEGTTVTISAAGDYTVSGTLNDGSIVVNAPKTDKVELYLNGVSITSSGSAAIRVEQVDSCVIHLAEGTENSLTDSAANEFSACLSAKDDLTIKGKGSLTVTGNRKHAIKSSNDVRIKNGNITVTAVKTGVYGEDSVQLTGGRLIVTSCVDGIKGGDPDAPEEGKGTVTVADAQVEVQSASGNGIEAVLSVTISSGAVKINSVKQAINCDQQDIADGCLFG